MNPIVLVVKDRPDAKENYACGGCNRFYGGDQKLAARCCLPDRYCGECDAKLPASRVHLCDACYAPIAAKLTAEAADREAARFEAAKKVSYEEYPEVVVFWEGAGSGDMEGDGYWSSLDALLEKCDEDGIERPKYVWGVRRQYLSLDAETVLEREFESGEFHDGVGDHVPKALHDELDAFLKAWTAKLKEHLWSYFLDTSTAVLVPEASDEP